MRKMHRQVDKWKQRIALAIMFHSGQELTAEQQEMMIDLEVEYKAVKDKTSNLSRMKRDEIEYIWESLQRIAAKEKEVDAESVS